MQCINITTLGVVQKVNPNADGTCPSYVLLNQADYNLMVQAYSLSPDEVLHVFSWGFGVVLLFWSLGYAIGVAKGLISKL